MFSFFFRISLSYTINRGLIAIGCRISTFLFGFVSYRFQSNRKYDWFYVYGFPSTKKIALFFFCCVCIPFSAYYYRRPGRLRIYESPSEAYRRHIFHVWQVASFRSPRDSSSSPETMRSVAVRQGTLIVRSHRAASG